MIKERLTNCILCNSERINYDDLVNDLCRCLDCGLIFHNPRPTFDAIKNFYSRIEKTDSWMGRGESEYAWDRLAQRRLNFIKRYKKEGSILDIGCGIGRFLNVAKKDFEIFGTEISENAITIAKKKYNINNIMLGNFDDLKLGKRTFDVITLWHVLEHLPYPGETLIKIKRFLSDDGILVIAVPNDDGLWFSRRLKNFALGCLAREIDKTNKIAFKLSMVEQNEVHLSHFTNQVLNNYLSLVGYNILDQSLDPYFVATGWKLFKQCVYYKMCVVFKLLFKSNLYETILIVAAPSVSM